MCGTDHVVLTMWYWLW